MKDKTLRVSYRPDSPYASDSSGMVETVEFPHHLITVLERYCRRTGLRPCELVEAIVKEWIEVHQWLPLGMCKTCQHWQGKPHPLDRSPRVRGCEEEGNIYVDLYLEGNRPVCLFFEPMTTMIKDTRHKEANLGDTS